MWPFRKQPPSLPVAIIRGALAALIVSGISTVATAQNDRPIRLIVPVPPGGAADILARNLAAQMAKTNAGSLVIESRPGAGTVIGTEWVARAAPDGNTLLLNAPYILINPQLKKVNYDPLRDFEPVCDLVSSPGVFVVNSKSPYKTLDDLLTAARTTLGTLSIGSAGPGTAQQIGIEMLKRAADVSLTYVPYPGGAPAINDLLGGHVTAVLAEYAPLASHLQTGSFRALATTGHERIAQLPDIPTVAESGFRNYEVDFWWGLFAPAKTPPATVSHMAELFVTALRAPDIQPKLSLAGFSFVGKCGPDFAVMLREQYERYGRVIHEAKIRAD
jgi:tripartite-type tricarboxylate transporter receptor subunit TctC